jgi:hypothetical protein
MTDQFEHHADDGRRFSLPEGEIENRYEVVALRSYHTHPEAPEEPGDVVLELGISIPGVEDVSYMALELPPALAVDLLDALAYDLPRAMNLRLCEAVGAEDDDEDE